MLGLKEMKDMFRGQGDMMKLGPLGLVFCSFLQPGLWYKDLVFQWTKKSTSMGADADNLESEPKKASKLSRSRF